MALGSGLAILLPAFPSIVLRIAGFHPVDQGGLTAVNDDIPIILEPRPSSAVTLLIDGNRVIDFPADILPALQIGLDETGAEIAQIFLSSNDILALCQRYTDYCGEDGSPIRRGRTQVNGSELLIEGEAYIDVLNRWQAFQLLLRSGADKTVEFESITLEGVRYSIPDQGLGRFLRDIQAKVNGALGSLTARHDGSIYELASFGVSGDQLVVTFRGG